MWGGLLLYRRLTRGTPRLSQFAEASRPEGIEFWTLQLEEGKQGTPKGWGLTQAGKGGSRLSTCAGPPS